MTAYYLGASTAFAEELESVAEELRARGHVVTSRWHSGELGEVSVDVKTQPGPCAERANADLLDVVRADVVVFRAGEPPGRHSRGGRHAEFGFALERALRDDVEVGVVLIYAPEHVFHWHPRVARYSSWYAWLRSVPVLDPTAMMLDREHLVGLDPGT